MEHSRIFYFLNDENDELYCSSADLMDRNLYHRVEICFPILNEALKRRIKTETLDLLLDHKQQRWQQNSNGQYIQQGRQSSQALLLKKYT